MAKTTGTATDYLDLMLHLRDFLTGSVGSPSPWAIMRDTTPAGSPVVYPSPVTQEMIFEGDASNGGSPERKFYFGIQSYEDPGSSVYGWDLKGFTGFDDGSPVGSVLFADQPDASPSAYVPLANSSMDYWIWANERRVIMVIKTGTSYQWLYAGFMSPFATESEYPYPMVIMGSSHTNTYEFSSNAVDFSTGCYPCGDSNQTTITTATAPIWQRFTDGAWYPIKNGYKSGSALNYLYYRNMWPMKPYSQSYYLPQNAAPTDTFALWDQFYHNTQGGTPPSYLVQTPGSPDPITSLWPLTIMWNTPSMQISGEMDGIYWIHNNGGITSEDEIWDYGVSPAQRYLVFQNIHRTDPWMFMCVKDE